MTRTINATQLARAFGVQADEIDSWLEAGLPHIRRDRVTLFHEDEATWWIRAKGYDLAGPTLADFEERLRQAMTTNDLNQLAWDVHELRARGAIGPARARTHLAYLDRLRPHIAQEERDERELGPEDLWGDERGAA